jgi:4-nitrophenyl phosphatase
MAVLADSYDAFLFDLDGVLYRGTEVVAGAPEAVARLREAGKRVAFVTNNATRTPESVAARLTGFGIPASADEVESSALVTAAQLAARGVSEAFVVGEEGILQALQDKGIAIADVDAGSTEVVVVGLDRRVDYEKLRRASLLVQHGADEHGRLVSGNRRELARRGSVARGDRSDDRRAS